MGTWSILSGAGWGIIALRVILTLAAVQAVYLALVLGFGWMSRREAPARAKSPPRSDATRLDETP